MDRQDLEWMKAQSLYHSHTVNAQGGYSVWVKEGDGLHPWPFSCIEEYKRWSGHNL